MTRTGRTLTLLGMGIAAAMTASATQADDTPNFIDPGQLVFYEDKAYRFAVEDWVSLEPTASQTVKMIGYGQVTNVGVATTSTGTYSTDGLTSPHVSYPGIEVERVPHADRIKSDRVYISTSQTTGYTRISIRSRLASGGSFIHIVGSTGGRVTSTPRLSCYSTGSFTVC